MQCSACHYDNASGAKFCAECGARLTLACPSCGAAATAGQKFCVECGAPLTGGAAELPEQTASPRTYAPKHLAERILTSRSALEGERKQVTVKSEAVHVYEVTAAGSRRSRIDQARLSPFVRREHELNLLVHGSCRGNASRSSWAKPTGAAANTSAQGRRCRKA